MRLCRQEWCPDSPTLWTCIVDSSFYEHSTQPMHASSSSTQESRITRPFRFKLLLSPPLPHQTQYVLRTVFPAGSAVLFCVTIVIRWFLDDPFPLVIGLYWCVLPRHNMCHQVMSASIVAHFPWHDGSRQHSTYILCCILALRFTAARSH